MLLLLYHKICDKSPYLLTTKIEANAKMLLDIVELDIGLKYYFYLNGTAYLEFLIIGKTTSTTWPTWVTGISAWPSTPMPEIHQSTHCRTRV